MLDQRHGHVVDHRLDTRELTILIVAAGINLEKTKIYDQSTAMLARGFPVTVQLQPQSRSHPGPKGIKVKGHQFGKWGKWVLIRNYLYV